MQNLTKLAHVCGSECDKMLLVGKMGTQGNQVDPATHCAYRLRLKSRKST